MEGKKKKSKSTERSDHGYFPLKKDLFAHYQWKEGKKTEWALQPSGQIISKEYK